MVSQFIANGIIIGSVYSLVALGFSLIYGTTRFFHFAHGAVYAIAAYFVYTFKVIFNFPLWISCILSIMGASILGILMELVIYRPLRRKKASNLILLLSSLGIFIVLQNTLSLLFGDAPKTIRSGSIKEGFNFGGTRITEIQIIIIIVSFILFIFFSLIVKYSKTGKSLRAVANDPELATIVGINTNNVILFAFFIGSVMAGIAAILVSFDIDMTPIMGLNALLMGVIAVIIGGIGNISGAYISGLFLGLIQQTCIWLISSKWQDTIVFGILILFLLFKPYGIFGFKIKKAEI